MTDNRQGSSLFGALFYPAIILAVLIVLALLVISFRSGEPSSAQRQAADNTRTVDSEVMQRFESEYDRLGVAVGDPDAPITIREFADYQCPACASFASTAERVREELVDSGQARFVFFDFPLPMHEHAQTAAVAARCAARQDRFWPYHDRLFETQSQWARSNDARSMFLDLAVETGVDADRLEQCMDQGGPDELIAANREAAQAIGLRATPTVMVGDTVFSGAIGYEQIRQAMDAQAAAGSAN